MSKNKFLKFISSLILILSTTILCNHNLKSRLDFENDFLWGVYLFENKKCDKAVEAFKSFISKSYASEYIDDAIFYLGKSYYCLEQYADGITHFRTLISDYPESFFSEEAHYLIAEGYYKQSPGVELDQTSTQIALETLENLLSANPSSDIRKKAEDLKKQCREKLAKKIFLSIELYIKLKEWKSAYIYINKLLDEYPETTYSAKAIVILKKIKSKLPTNLKE